MLSLFTLPLFVLRDLLPLGGEVFVHWYLYLAAGSVLWALALYLGFFPVAEWVMEQLWRWFNFAERSLYPSQQEFEQTRRVRETINAIYASLLSIVPFLVLGLGCAYWVCYHLGPLECLVCGIGACLGGGIYQLGRRDGQPSA